MRTGTRFLTLLVLAAAVGIIAYILGQRKGRSESRTELIENYSFVRDIAELASVEVSGTTTYKSTNVPEDETGPLTALRKYFFEKSVTLTVPYTAKYGVDLSQDSIRIRRVNDSVLRLDLPKPKLLSYELRLDRQEASRTKGIMLLQDDQFYTAFQKKLYTQSRAQLAGNTLYLNRAQDRICGLLQQYFRGAGQRTECHFGGSVAAPLD